MCHPGLAHHFAGSHSVVVVEAIVTNRPPNTIVENVDGSPGIIGSVALNPLTVPLVVHPGAAGRLLSGFYALAVIAVGSYVLGVGTASVVPPAVFGTVFEAKIFVGVA